MVLFCGFGAAVIRWRKMRNHNVGGAQTKLGESPGRALFSGFADELLKLSSSSASSESLGDVVGAEALGPIASAVKGYQRKGWRGAARAAAGYAVGGGAGAALGALGAKGLKHVVGRDVGVGPVRAGTVLPAMGALLLGLKAERWANK